MIRVAGFAPLLLAVALALAGCGDGDTGDTGGADSPSPTATASPSTEAGGTSTPSSSVAPTTPAASVTAATGQRFDSVAFSLVVPDGWAKGGVSQSGQVTSATFTSPDQTTLLDLLRVVSPGQLGFEEAAQIAGSEKNGVTRQADREVGGRQVFVFTGDDDNGTTCTVGTVTGQGYATIQLTFAPASVTGVAADPAAQQALVDSILATVEWKD